MLKEGSQFICLSVILISSVFRKSKNNYPQVLLEEYKHVVKDKKIPEYITDETDIFSESGREYSGEKNSNEEYSDEGYFIE